MKWVCYVLVFITIVDFGVRNTEHGVVAMQLEMI